MTSDFVQQSKFTHIRPQQAISSLLGTRSKSHMTSALKIPTISSVEKFGSNPAFMQTSDKIIGPHSSAKQVRFNS